jgi:hypothetical protein
MKICPVGAEFFHADGQTDRHDEANCRFSQFDESAINRGHLDSNVLCFEKMMYGWC